MSKILIVDDEKDMCWTLSKFLEKHGYTAVSVLEGDSAVEKIKEEHFDLVLLDMQMPKKDGLKVLKEIRSIDESLPVVLVTGYGSPEVAAQAIQLGANDYLSKPFDNKSLLNVVTKNQGSTRISKPQTKWMTDDVQRLPEPLVKKIYPVPQKEAVFSKISLPIERRKSGVPISLAGIVLAIIFVLVGSFWGVRKFSSLNLFAVQSKTFELSYAHPSAVAVKGNEIWVADWFNQSLYRYDAKVFSLLAIYPIKGVRPSGMAWVGSELYVCDSWKKEILKFDFNDKNLSLNYSFSVPSPGSSPSGICWDGENLWSCDLEQAKIYKHNLDDSLTAVENYLYPGKKPIALGWDGKNLWSLDISNEMIFLHDMDASLSPINQYPIKKNFPEVKKAVSLFISPDELLLISEEPLLLSHHPIAFRIGTYIYGLKKR